MRLKKCILLSIIFIFAFTAFAAGCTPAKRPIVDGNRNVARKSMPNNNTTNPNMTNPNVAPLPDTNTAPARPNTTTDNDTRIRTMETRVADEIVKIPGVRNATVLINNNTAYVGVELDQATESRQIAAVKDKIIRKTKEVENKITTVHVSADVDVVGRLRGFQKDVRGGRPISGMIEEIEDMFRRAIPGS